MKPPLDIPRRLRRLRSSAAMRDLLRETHLRPEHLIQPLFVVEGSGQPQPIASMPGQSRLPMAHLLTACEAALAVGIKAVALFPKLDHALKTPDAAEALNPETLALRAIREVKRAFPELLVIADIALDPYTSHGHDGILTPDGRDVANDITVEKLCQMAQLSADAGADIVAPSDMMDGRVGHLRKALDTSGHTGTAILAYAAKFNSAYYGPFRDAVGSAQAAGTTLLDKATYQLDPANRRQAKLETALDEAEAADMLMVKPAGPYLDVIRDLRERTDLPVAAYQVSGEYAQLHGASQAGWLDLKRCRDESLLAIRRAGADLILTYFATEVARDLRG